MTYEQALEEQIRLKTYLDLQRKGYYVVRVVPKTHIHYINFISKIKSQDVIYGDVQSHCPDDEYQIISFPITSTEYL